MKEKGILNSEISKRLSDLGHTDLIAVGDCGLPIDSDKKIDLALKLGEPKFIDVLEILLSDFGCEYYYLAKEIKEKIQVKKKILKNFCQILNANIYLMKNLRKN